MSNEVNLLPDIFLKACSDLNALPENCLVLEDSEAGIEVAYRAGIQSYVFQI